MLKFWFDAHRPNAHNCMFLREQKDAARGHAEWAAQCFDIAGRRRMEIWGQRPKCIGLNGVFSYSHIKTHENNAHINTHEYTRTTQPHKISHTHTHEYPHPHQTPSITDLGFKCSLEIVVYQMTIRSREVPPETSHNTHQQTKSFSTEATDGSLW